MKKTEAQNSKVVSMETLKRKETYDENRATFGKRVYENRTRAGMTQAKLASILGIHKNYVSNWEQGLSRPDLGIVPDLCRALGITIPEFFGIYGEMTGLEQDCIHKFNALDKRDRATVAALTDSLWAMEQTERREACIRNFISIYHNNNTAAAGTLNDMDDGTSGNRVYLRRNADTERADEIITVSGDSMEPTFRDGDALLVEHTTEIRRGEIGIFVINGEGFVKEYRGDGVYSHNAEKYPFRKFLPDDDIRCIGRVLGKVRKDLLPTDEEKELLKD